jgi:shikimate kinase
MDSSLKRSPGVYLTGFMGSGKTTVAKALADRLGWDFLDLDAEIESAENATIAAIFEARGEREFRRIETEMIRRVLHMVERGVPTVIALGGGSFVQPANAALLSTRGISIWLDCPFEVIQQRITDSESRPLARDPDGFRELYEERRAAYSLAHYRVDGACEVDRAVQSILDLPFWKK